VEQLMTKRAWRMSLGVLALSGGLLAQAGYVPVRVFDSVRGTVSDFEAMLADIARADVVFVGEQHDDRNTHRLELAVLEGVARRRPDAIVAMEMFERDVQEPLDHFLMGHTGEEEFLKVGRPWPRYATDYKPLVDFAIAKNWPVVASNVPRSLASEVSKGGLDVLASKSAEEHQWFARDLQCPLDDDYFKRFGEAMGDHPASPSATDAAAVATARQTLERFYFAQCLKDETMGESVALAYSAGGAGGKSPLVVHFNGAFHSDFGEGTAERARRRLPGKRVVVVTMLPVANLDTIAPDGKERTRADYLVYTMK
jgi:uncharacterized iron-regulated protein